MGAIHELCFLQLRMLCELIALGCLTAHGDLETGKLKKAYEADEIIGRLQRLHPHFYPHAARQTKQGPDRYDAILLKDGFLTKGNLRSFTGDVARFFIEEVSEHYRHANTGRRILKRL